MLPLNRISVAGILVGFVTVVASSIVFSLLSLFIFSELIEGGGDDVLMTAAGPLVYATAVLALSMILGVIVCSRLSKAVSLVNTIGLVIVYCAFSYMLSQSPSNLTMPYPDWFVAMKYAILFPAAFVGHILSARRATPI